MTVKLIIPDEALEAAREAAMQKQSTKASVEAAAPFIVAAELERLVEETDWAWAVGDSLKRRAAELRGGGQR